MKKGSITDNPMRASDLARHILSGRKTEQRLLRWLHDYYESLLMARPKDKSLSYKLICIHKCEIQNYKLKKQEQLQLPLIFKKGGGNYEKGKSR